MPKVYLYPYNSVMGCIWGLKLQTSWQDSAVLVSVWHGCSLFSELSQAANRQYGQEPLALARLGAQFSQNMGSRALSGSTLRGAGGSAGTAPNRWLFLWNHRKSFVIAGPVLAQSTDTMPASIYQYTTETEEFASVSSDTHTQTHTHTNTHTSISSH